MFSEGTKAENLPNFASGSFNLLRSSLQRGVCGGVVTSNHETADGLSCFDAGL